MAVIIPVIAAAAATYGATAGAVALGISAATASLIGAVAGVIVSVAATMLMSSLMKSSSSTPSLPDGAQDRKQAVRSAIEPRRVIYGRALVSGPIVYMASSGTDSEFINLVLPIAAHPIDDFESVWINGREQTLSAPGVGGIDGQDRGGGGSEDFATGVTDAQTVGFNPAAPAMSGSLLIHTYDGTQTSADGLLISESHGEWSANHKLLGTPYIYTRIKYSPNLYPQGFESLSATVRGAKLFDPRDSTTHWSMNPALAIRDYLTAPYGMRCSLEEIDDDSFMTAANICEEEVALDVAETLFQQRYQINGSFKLDMQPTDIMERLLSSCGGTLVYVQGAYRLYAAAYDTPAITLTESDFAGPIQVMTQHSRKDLFNAVRGTFIDPTQKWSAVDFPMVTDSDFTALDGEQIVVDVEFGFTTDSAMAQRLSRIQLLRHRFGQLVVQAPLKYSALRLAAWDAVAIDFADLGWSGKVFRVASWKFDPVTAGVTAELHEDNFNSYTWTALDAAPPLDTPDTSLVDPLIIPVPFGLTLTSTTELDSDGHLVPGLLAQWSVGPHPFLTGAEVQWKKHADSVWSSREVPRPTNHMFIAPTIAGVDYDCRVRSIAGLVRSAWCTVTTASAGVDTTPPGLVTSFAAFPQRGGVFLQWTNPTDTDLARVIILETPTSSFSGATWEGFSSGTSLLRSGLHDTTTHYYWAATQDYSGNQSTFVGPISGAPEPAGTADIASHAITQGDAVTQNDSITVHFDTGTLIVQRTISVPGGGDVFLLVRADLVQGAGLPGGSGGGGEGGEGDGF